MFLMCERLKHRKSMFSEKIAAICREKLKHSGTLPVGPLGPLGPSPCGCSCPSSWLNTDSPCPSGWHGALWEPGSDDLDMRGGEHRGSNEAAKSLHAINFLMFHLPDIRLTIHAQRTRAHLTPPHWPLCHLGLY